ncbi:MAG: hypothetical protein RJB13_1089 [Pseudomonadota bacterium]
MAGTIELAPPEPEVLLMSAELTKNSFKFSQGTTQVPEILAPVGGREQFYAALNSGADAVFLGLKNFNARARAENFTIEDLRELVPLAHKHDMKILVTMNILIKNSELHSLCTTLADLEDVGVDAIIVQDLGLARLCRQYFPNMRLHASTQMAVHNADGVIEAMKAGMKRVVLARELTAIEIKRIRKAVPLEDVEIEVFCHGSLCYSYSGLCFFSGAEDARSGNRGECAYTCRKPYKIISEPGHGFLFSMKDLNTVDSLHLLIDAGVDALKIEGRKKDAQYVTSVIQSYRRKLDELFGRPTLRPAAPASAHTLYTKGTDSNEELKNKLTLSFQRDNTNFFLKGRYAENVIDLNNPTHKGQKVGVVEAISGQWIEFTPECTLERFDGIRIDPSESLFHSTPQHGDQLNRDHTAASQKYQNQTIQFSLRRMFQDGKTAVVASAGSKLKLEIPEHAQGIKVGDIVVRTRSDAMRREVEQISRPPVDSQIKPYNWIDTSIELQNLAGQIELIVTFTKNKRPIGRFSSSFQAIRPKNSGTALTSDLRDLFKIFGNIGVSSRTTTVAGDTDWFIPRSQLKEFKREIEEALLNALETARSERINVAFESLAKNYLFKNTKERSGKSTCSIKIDRLEYLDWIKSYFSQCQTNSNLVLSEIVFEPKRAFLKDFSNEETANALLEMSSTLGISVRVAFPTVLRAWDEPLMKRWYETFVNAGVNLFEVGNMGALNKLQEWNRGESIESISSDFTMYTLNSSAAQHWREKGLSQLALSVEDDLINLTDLMTMWPDGTSAQAILYKDTPLFIAESCSLTALHNGCPTNAVCGYRTLEIENDNKERFFVAHEACKSIVYDSKAYSITHKRKALEDIGINNFRIDFLTRPYTETELKAVLSAAENEEPVGHTHTANFNRRLL